MTLGERIYTAAEKLAAAEREVKFRKYVYARRVAEKQMTQKLADEQIAVMQAIAEDYAEKAKGERLL
jgi:hypothetical protein